MLDFMQKYFPKRLIICLKRFRQTSHLYYYSYLQAKRFNKFYSKVNPNDAKQIETRIIYLTHQIEKGLSHSDFRYNFGKKIFLELPRLLNNYERINSDYKNNIFYNECISALHEYVKKHVENNQNLDFQKRCFTSEQWNNIINNTSGKGGTIDIYKNDKLKNSSLAFIDLFTNRHSIREFSDENVSIDLIERAIQISMRTPSVCNRQATRIHVITNPEKIAKALSLQSGVNGFPTPPVLILVTTDIRAFMTAYERNEGFVDGGLFAMSLLLSLESIGLGACPLNTMFNKTIEEKTRALLNIPDNEYLIMYIEIGHYPKHVRTCKSLRYNYKDITVIE